MVNCIQVRSIAFKSYTCSLGRPIRLQVPLFLHLILFRPLSLFQMQAPPTRLNLQGPARPSSSTAAAASASAAVPRRRLRRRRLHLHLLLRRRRLCTPLPRPADLPSDIRPSRRPARRARATAGPCRRRERSLGARADRPLAGRILNRILDCLSCVRVFSLCPYLSPGESLTESPILARASPVRILSPPRADPSPQPPIA